MSFSTYFNRSNRSIGMLCDIWRHKAFVVFESHVRDEKTIFTKLQQRLVYTLLKYLATSEMGRQTSSNLGEYSMFLNSYFSGRGIFKLFHVVWIPRPTKQKHKTRETTLQMGYRKKWNACLYKWFRDIIMFTIAQGKLFY